MKTDVCQRNQVPALKTPDGRTSRTRLGIEAECSRFYKDLFASKTPVDPPEMQHDAIPAIPSVLTSEVRHAIQNIQKDRAPGLNGIEVELLKEGGPTL
ncbi:unnamed protein product [Leuciscus chuanchicus]